MALTIRMARGGRKNLPYFRIVVADKRCPRDGRYLEKVGTYNPLLGSDSENRVVLNEERIKYWLSQGAQPSERIARFLGKAGIIAMPKWNETPQKSAPKAKAQERVKEKADKIVKAEEAKVKAEEAQKQAAADAKAAAEAPAPEAAPEAASEAPTAE